jgi:Zn-dependent protease with chaperone function
MTILLAYEGRGKDTEDPSSQGSSGRRHQQDDDAIGVAGILLVILPLVMTLMETPAWAAGAPRDAGREAAITAELRARSPEAVADFEAATAALDKNDYTTAATGYRRVLERAPDFDVALRRLASSLVQHGEMTEGIALAERAILVRETPENLASLAQCLALPPGPSKPSPDVLRRAFTLIVKAIALAPTDPDYLALKASIALQLDDRAAFESASAALCRQAPDLMATHYFAAIVAATNEEWLKADREIREAGRLGLPADAVQAFLDTGVGSQARVRWWGMLLAWAVGLWILGLVLMFLTGKTLSIITLASIERDDPNRAVSGRARRLRTIYRRIVTVAGVYWYVSLPFVAVIIVAVAAAVIYACLAVGRIPVKLVVILLLGAVMSLYAIVRSLFVRIRDEEAPGRAISELDAPGLWKTAREVAVAVGTRPIDEIWLTPGTDLSVLERGTARQRMTDRAPRALLLGAGVLEGFEQGAFRAVLAHEYGHFSHRDTAGGDVALRVRYGMMAFALALAKAGFAVWWNLAFQFLRLYDLLFRRISHGATRLQEVLADRVAIQHYGLPAFRNGLTHVIRRSLLFQRLANNEIQQAVRQERLLSNLYSLAAPSDPTMVNDMEEQVTKRLQAKTTEDDTHPSPKDRLRLGERIHFTTAYQPDGYVWQLFRDPAALMAEMTSLVAQRICPTTAPRAAEH